MSGPAKPPLAGAGAAMTLYANLLDPKAAGSASAAEKSASGDAAVKKPTLDPATLRFQPVRRPQPAQKQKPKISVGFPKAASVGAATSSTATAAPPGAQPAAVAAATQDLATPSTAGLGASAAAANPPARSGLAAWAPTEEDELMYGAGGKRQRGGRKAKKKNNRDGPGQRQMTDWDELYDPARPTIVEEYLRSDERIAEIREWKAVLNAHRISRDRDRSLSSSDIDEEMGDGGPVNKPSNQFAPPPSYSFAPPPPSPPRRNVSQDEQTARPLAHPAPSPPDDATGEDAYARRMALSTGGPAVAAPRSVSPLAPVPAASATSPAAAPGLGAEGAAAATISRAPVRYDEMDVDQDAGYDNTAAGTGAGIGYDDEEEEDRPHAGLGAGNNEQQQQQQSSNRPGQSGFAERLMKNMGWEKGRGLGAQGNEGIVKGLSIKLDKRRRLPDSEGGGFAQPAGIGRIVGAKLPPPRAAAAGGSGSGASQSEGKFGRMSEVVVLRGMLEGMQDVAAEVEKGLSQEIGEECGEKYGRVERIYVHVDSREVFIKFTDQVSALRAVNALQGRIFNGNTIVPAFYDAEKFEGGVYQ